jgi:N-acetylneuraminic acid mutarotase
VGGYDGISGDPTVLATTDGRTYLSVASLPVAVRYPAVAALGGRIYVIGGEVVGGPDNGEASRDIQLVDPQTGSARVLMSMSEPLEGASAFTISGHIYVAGGNTSSGSSAKSTSPAIWAFDPLTQKMLRAGTLRVAVSNAGFAVLGTTAWLVGGETDGVLSTAVQMLRVIGRAT